MKKNPKIICFLLTLILLIGVFFYFQRHDIEKESRSVNGTEKIPPAETVTLNREGDGTVIKVKEEQPVVVPTNQLKDDKLTLSSMPTVTSREDSVDLKEHTYSIKNKKKEIILSPGVSLQPSKGITIKIPGEEEVIKVQRDKTYHSDSIHMFWEKKY
ncbi:hypothetical protein [Pelosinus fermentans]|uniref:Uncharacterized protein n=1 Tax=Pelosinus fermentans B4 TaxID=1149862 RepID=I9LFC9_9FIRM|nr:hypothetical protein [Pelosinus fermentans]EIW19194.1 hypothetical protein FB4_2904 [Pelosinus fermentans B4]EIW25074.1 hypothetical protein FA11_2934 [Pelosinus fermentans A11]OAM96175.1 hypothetical protein FR7_04197 [Pelosinus fermentans DSM 17108]SDR37175.1 hypothetical protein SAMN04515679_4368 [Pelosinus fermentans]